MDSFYIVTIGIIVVLQISFQMSSGAPTNATVTETACPRLQTRTVNGSLIVMYQKSNEFCEMVVKIEAVQLSPAKEVKAFKNKHKTIRRPLVSFRNDATLDGQVPCKPLTHTRLGPFVFVNTVPNQCQMLLMVLKTKNPNHEPKHPRPPKGKGRRKNDKKKGEKKGKPTKIPKYHFIPTFEYIDEVLY